ncbi:MAG: DMP19 family protein [Firmicutes bacterium]|nr:DMP19 family protein [Bacillota bacterium]
MKKKNEVDVNLLDYIERLQKKCKNGKKIKKLNPTERIIYLISEFEAEVNNGGFDQFFTNSTGNYASETIECLKKIEALHTASLLREAIDTIASAKSEEDLAEIEEKLDKLDDKFYEYEDNLEELQVRYIKDNIIN